MQHVLRIWFCSVIHNEDITMLSILMISIALVLLTIAVSVPPVVLLSGLFSNAKNANKSTLSMIPSK